MKISKKLQEAINSQINRELYSEYLYLSMAAYFEDINLPGFANWMKVQAEEERFHAMKFYGYLAERGGRVKMLDIEAPPGEWKGPEDVFLATLEHEQKVTELINNLVNIALAEKDHATSSFLNWFVDEQVEEEASAEALLQQLKRMGEGKSALYMLDKELSTRVFTPQGE